MTTAWSFDCTEQNKINFRNIYLRHILKKDDCVFVLLQLWQRVDV